MRRPALANVVRRGPALAFVVRRWRLSSGAAVRSPALTLSSGTAVRSPALASVVPR